MRVLVTGGGGFIGSALAEALAERGDDVRVVDSFLTGSKQAVPDSTDLIEADLRDMNAIRGAFDGVEVVFHQAAYRSVPKSVEDPLLATECNVLGTMNVLIAAAEAGVRRVVYASSSSVYGERAIEGACREDALPTPMSPYAASKLAGEHYCAAWTHVHGLDTVSLRYFNVFGPGQNPDSKYSTVFPAFISALAAGRPPEVHWDGEQAKDFTYIDDVVRANILGAEAGDEAGGSVVNIGGGDPKSINNVLKDVSDAIGAWIEPKRLPKRAGDVRRTHADISLAKELLGWEPVTDWRQAVAATVSWFKER